ncbi:MAG: FkbM family methyltransferase [Opitutae bacterium]|nr:FkbM family methyltransferase [Opitutae bacterium]
MNASAISSLATSAPAGRRSDWRDRLLTRHYRRRWRGFFPLRRLLRPEGEIYLRTRYGAEFPLRVEEYIDSVVLREGFYESEVFEALRPWLVAGGIFWDIGANIGLHAVSAARLEPRLRVHAFEPNPATLARLRTHLALNAVEVRAWPLALGAADGDAPLYLANDANSGRCTLVAAAGAPDWRSIRVPVARADTLIARGAAPAPTVVKLDVEGGEPSVLAGFGALLHAPALRAIVIEATVGPHGRPHPDCPSARLLRAAGFSFRELTRREDTAHLLGNYLAFRP